MLENRQPLLLSQPARNTRDHRPVRQINNQASIDLGMLQQVTINHLSPLTSNPDWFAGPK